MTNDTTPVSPPEENELPKLASEENVEKPRKIGCITIMWIAALVLMFLVWYNGLRSVPLRISPETTYITEPLTPDGKRVDFAAAFKQKFYPPEIATDENGYRMVFRHFGDQYWYEKLTPNAARKLYEELGLDPNVPPDMTYRDFYTYLGDVHKFHPEELSETVEILEQRGLTRTEDPNEIARLVGESSENPHEFPIVGRWIEESSPALDIIAEAVAKPVYFFPFISEEEPPTMMMTVNSNGIYQESRNFARSFHLRIKYRVGTGDFDGAIDDILACYRLGRHVGKQGTLICALVGIALEGIASATAIDVQLTERASAEQIERLAEGIRNLPPRVTVEQCLETERFFVLDMIQIASDNKTEFFGHAVFSEWQTAIASRLGYNWNLIARKYNKDIDKFLNGTSMPPAPRSIRPWLWLTLDSRSREMANMFGGIGSGIDAFRAAFHRQECSDNMKQITLAMLIYERRNGTLPPAFTVDADGRPLHGWRTLLLPYLGDESLVELSSQIRLDEPWDSEHNRQFHTRNLDIYRCPAAVKKDGEANYAVIVGKEPPFGDDGRGRPLADLKRHQILLVERKEGVCWMRPDAEIPQHVAETDGINKAAASIGSNHRGGANFGMRDGSLSFLSETSAPVNFTGYIRGSDTRLFP